MHIQPTTLLAEAVLAVHEASKLKPGESKVAGRVEISDRDSHVEVTFTVRRDAPKSQAVKPGPSSTSKGQ